MPDKSMSRRKFLVGAGAVLGAASVSGLVLAERPTKANAAGAATVLPWPYDTQLDPEALARRAYEIYYSSGCAEATWWPVIEALAPNHPDTWGTLPKNIMKYGGGGVASWGTVCGTCNGSCAVIGMTGAPTALSDTVMQYYGETPLPTNGADNAARAGWTPAAPALAPRLNVPTSVAHSQLCHASLTQWAMTAGNGGADTTINAIGKPGQKDRCAKACYDMTKKTVTLLNDYFLNKVTPTPILDPSVADCKTCHTPNAMGKMACDSCHDETTSHASGD